MKNTMMYKILCAVVIAACCWSSIPAKANIIETEGTAFFSLFGVTITPQAGDMLGISGLNTRVIGLYDGDEGEDQQEVDQKTGDMQTYEES